MTTRRFTYLLLTLILPGPGLADTVDETIASTLRIEGSSTLAPVAEVWAAAFEERHPQIRVELKVTGTTDGLAALIDGRADVALASRPAKAGELERATARGLALERTAVARDALAVIVHRDNPVDALTRPQLRGLFSGELRSWAEVGGSDAPVVVVRRNPGAHTGAFFQQEILGDASFAAGSVETSDREESIARVAASPRAIGFTGLGDALNSKREVKVLRIEHGGEASFAISRRLYVYASKTPPKPVARFLEFVLSREGQELVLESNFFPLDAR